MNLLEKLEEVKQLGAYSVSLYYGEGTGCDDQDVPTLERNFKIAFEPVGYLGEVRGYYKGTVQSFLDFDFSTLPTAISNPPKDGELENNGFYCWGAERSIENYKNQGYFFPKYDK